MRGWWIPVALAGALALAGCSDAPKESKGDKGDPGPPGPKRSGRCRYDAEGCGSPIIDRIVPDRRNHDQRILHRHLYRLSAGPTYERCTLWRQPQFDNPARDDRLRKTIARTPASMPGMEEDEMHGRIRGPGKFATSFKRAELLDVHRFRDGP